MCYLFFEPCSLCVCVCNCSCWTTAFKSERPTSSGVICRCAKTMNNCVCVCAQRLHSVSTWAASLSVHLPGNADQLGHVNAYRAWVGFSLENFSLSSLMDSNYTIQGTTQALLCNCNFWNIQVLQFCFVFSWIERCGKLRKYFFSISCFITARSALMKFEICAYLKTGFWKYFYRSSGQG